VQQVAKRGIAFSAGEVTEMLLQTSKTDVIQKETEIGKVSIYRGQGERPLTRKIKQTKIHKQRHKDNRHYTGDS